MTPVAQLAAIRERVGDLMAAVAVEYRDVLRPALEKEGIRLVVLGGPATRTHAPG